MSKQKARIWIGVIILAVIALNYILIGTPLYRRIASLEKNIKVLMIKQVKEGRVLNSSEDTYIIDILKKEAISVDRKIVILNCVAASATIIALGWVVYGLILRDDRRKQV